MCALHVHGDVIIRVLHNRNYKVHSLICYLTVYYMQRVQTHTIIIHYSIFTAATLGTSQSGLNKGVASFKGSMDPLVLYCVCVSGWPGV